MTVIKLGHNTYRVYSTNAGASFLFFVKGAHEDIILKRSDVPKQMPETVKAYLISSAEFALKAHIEISHDLWTKQGFLMGVMS